MNTIFFKRLKEALETTSIRVAKEGKYSGQLATANAAAVELFSSTEDVYRGRKNVSFFALWRTSRYAKRSGIEWPTIDWEALLQWVYDNWAEILKLLLPLLFLI